MKGIPVIWFLSAADSGHSLILLEGRTIMAERRDAGLDFLVDTLESTQDQGSAALSQPMFFLPFPPQVWSLEE